MVSERVAYVHRPGHVAAHWATYCSISRQNTLKDEFFELERLSYLPSHLLLYHLSKPLLPISRNPVGVLGILSHYNNPIGKNVRALTPRDIYQNQKCVLRLDSRSREVSQVTFYQFENMTELHWAITKERGCPIPWVLPEERYMSFNLPVSMKTIRMSPVMSWNII